jgi:hypothetical protein
MHRKVLTKAASELFGALSRFPGFHLAGGTALALQIGQPRIGRLQISFSTGGNRRVSADHRRKFDPSARVYWRRGAV